jgi:transposase
MGIVRRGSASTICYRRAMIVLDSSGGKTVSAIAQLVAAGEDTVRDVIRTFNEMGPSIHGPAVGGPSRLPAE